MSSLYISGAASLLTCRWANRATRRSIMAIKSDISPLNPRRLGDQPLAVEQDGKSLQRPALLQLGAVVRMLGVEHPEFERHRMLVQRDQRFLAVGRERMREELEAHAGAASPRTAASILATSIFCISIIASNARFATSPPLAIASVRTRGVICHDRPHLSLHQPHALSAPPLPTIAFQ